MVSIVTALLDVKLVAVVDRLIDGLWLGPPCVVSIVTALLDVKLVAVVDRLIDGLWLGPALPGEYCDGPVGCKASGRGR